MAQNQKYSRRDNHERRGTFTGGWTTEIMSAPCEAPLCARPPRARATRRSSLPSPSRAGGTGVKKEPGCPAAAPAPCSTLNTSVGWLRVRARSLPAGHLLRPLHLVPAAQAGASRRHEQARARPSVRRCRSRVGEAQFRQRRRRARPIRATPRVHRYTCCQGTFPCSGRCCERQAPEPCLALEARAHPHPWCHRGNWSPWP